MSPRPRMSKAELVSGFRREQILDAARESFGTDGLLGATVDGIARRAGVAKGTVYLYYRSKDDILRQLLDEDLGVLHAQTVPGITGPGTLEERLVRFFTATLTVFEARRDFFEHAHFEMGADTRRTAAQRLERVFRAQVAAWRRALAGARRARLIGPTDLDASALAIVGLASGLARQRLRGWADGPIDTVAAHAGAMLWKGLAAR